jgi:protein-disulfide isomerase
MLRAKDLTLNVALVLVTTAAVAMVSIRVYDRWFVQANSGPETRRIVAWRNFGVAGNRIGPSTADVTIVEFSDFQCPVCRDASQELKEIRGQYPDRVAVVFRYFPLPIHPYATSAAHAAECAGKQHAFEAYQNLLFSSQELIGHRSWTDYARDAGVSDAFFSC